MTAQNHVRSITGAPIGTIIADRQPGALFIVEAARFSPRRRGAFGTSIAAVRCLPAASSRLTRASGLRLGEARLIAAHGSAASGAARGSGSERQRSGRASSESAADRHWQELTAAVVALTRRGDLT